MPLNLYGERSKVKNLSFSLEKGENDEHTRLTASRREEIAESTSQ